MGDTVASQSRHAAFSGGADSHPGMAYAFREGCMTIGATTPLEGFSGPTPRLRAHADLVNQAEQAGFATLWVRDVPLLDPTYGDAGQMLDAFTFLGYLAARTSRISLGTASIATPLRHPIDVAKAATSVDHLSGGRFLLGIATTQTLLCVGDGRKPCSSAVSKV